MHINRRPNDFLNNAEDGEPRGCGSGWAVYLGDGQASRITIEGERTAWRRQGCWLGLGRRRYSWRLV